MAKEKSKKKLRIVLHIVKKILSAMISLNPNTALVIRCNRI